jgi:signal transduction histidine kinase
MFPRRAIIIRQLQLIALLVAVVAIVMSILNLSYLTESQLRRVVSQLDLQRDQIYNALEKAALKAKEKDPMLAIANDAEVRSALQATINRIESLNYAAIVEENGNILTAVSIGHADQIGKTNQELQDLLDSYSFSQIASLIWGQATYEHSYQAALGPKSNGSALSVRLSFGVAASKLRGTIADIFIINLIIIIVGLILSILVAVRSADTLLHPMDALVNQIEKLERGELNLQDDSQQKLGVVADNLGMKLQMLSKRLAGERTELETTRGRLTQIIGNIEERLLLLNPEKRVMLMSPKVDHLLGVAGIDLAGARLDDIIGSGHPLIDMINRVKESHRSLEQIMLLDQNGLGPRQVLASVQFIEDKGDPIGMLVSLRDFDSFKQFQSQLDYSDKLAALGRITSGVAHEVKNPLNAMVIHLEILRAKLAQPGADFTPQLDILSSEIKRLDRVVQTFLNFTRPMQLNLVPIDLNDLVHQVTRLAAAEAAAHKVELREELSPEFLRVNGDADLLKQSLLNIILNGCQAMPQGGPLDIRTKRSGTYVMITIADRGFGIPQEARDKIFNLYYTTKENGNGIGLAQSFRAVQLHNGRIEFDSKIDFGTTFRIFLPEI